MPALAFHTFCTNFKKAGRKAYCVQNISSLNKLPAEFWSYQESYLIQKNMNLRSTNVRTIQYTWCLKGHC